MDSYRKECFFITPIGEEVSQERKELNQLKKTIQNVLDDFNYKLIVAHEIDDIGSINDQEINHLLHDDLVIANLTGLNPNVMYEVAVRHAAKLPIVYFAKKETKIPFNLASERIILYEHDYEGSDHLKKELKRKIQKALNTEDIDNPIYRVVKPIKTLAKNIFITRGHESFKTNIDIEKAKNHLMLHAAFYPTYYNTSYEEAYHNALTNSNFRIDVVLVSKNVTWIKEFAKILRPTMNSDEFLKQVDGSKDYFMSLKRKYPNQVFIYETQRLPLFPVVIIDKNIYIGHYAHSPFLAPSGFWLKIICHNIDEYIIWAKSAKDEIPKEVLSRIDGAVYRYIAECVDGITNGDEIQIPPMV